MAKKQKFKDAEREIYEFISRQQLLCKTIKERMATGNGHLNGHNLQDHEAENNLKKTTKA